MNKKEVQKRVLQDGKPLALSKFKWDEESKVFSTVEGNLVLDFKGVRDCTFKTGSSCTFKTGSSCTFDTGSDCTFNTGYNCTFDTGYNCTFDTGYNCTFDTGSSCTFKTGSSCTFKTGSSCTFDTGSDCTFNTGYNCTFDTGYNCTFDTGSDCVLVLRGTKTTIYDLNKFQGFTYFTEDFVPIAKPLKDVKLIDGSCMVILNTKIIGDFNTYETQYISDYFLDTNVKQFVVEQGKLTAHGETLKDAFRDIEFKRLSSQDVSEHIQRVKNQGYVSVQDYRLITGSCEYGTKSFLECRDLSMDINLSIGEVLKLTEGSYGHEKFKSLFIDEGGE